MGFSRREFIKLSAAGSLGLTLSLNRLVNNSAHADYYPYSGWKDLYRKKWTWDKVAKSTHDVNCWYQGRCTYAGILERKEAGLTPFPRSGIPIV